MRGLEAHWAANPVVVLVCLVVIAIVVLGIVLAIREDQR